MPNFINGFTDELIKISGTARNALLAGLVAAGVGAAAGTGEGKEEKELSADQRRKHARRMQGLSNARRRISSKDLAYGEDFKKGKAPTMQKLYEKEVDDRGRSATQSKMYMPKATMGEEGKRIELTNPRPPKDAEHRVL